MSEWDYSDAPTVMKLPKELSPQRTQSNAEEFKYDPKTSVPSATSVVKNMSDLKMGGKKLYLIKGIQNEHLLWHLENDLFYKKL